MDEIQPPSGPITLVVSDVVELSQVTAYEAWTAGINHDARAKPQYVNYRIWHCFLHSFKRGRTHDKQWPTIMMRSWWRFEFGNFRRKRRKIWKRFIFSAAKNSA